MRHERTEPAEGMSVKQELLQSQAVRFHLCDNSSAPVRAFLLLFFRPVTTMEPCLFSAVPPARRWYAELR